jgi:hypothetical protein
MDKLKLKLLQESMRHREWKKRLLERRIVQLQIAADTCNLSKRCPCCNSSMRKSHLVWKCPVCPHYEELLPE